VLFAFDNAWAGDQSQRLALANRECSNVDIFHELPLPENKDSASMKGYMIL
jgi:hypothetical protein